MKMLRVHYLLLALLVASVALGVAIASTKLGRTPGGGPSSPPYGPLPPGGGWTLTSLTLTGKLTQNGGVCWLQTDVPGNVVALRFQNTELESWAASHLGQSVTVSGHWDTNDSSTFVVESAATA